MGSQLMARGIKITRCPDHLCIEEPATVLTIHKEYIAAGTDAILTNTFGANPIALARYGLQADCRKINLAAARLARLAAGQDHYVLGDIGPSGGLLEPLGQLRPDQLRSAFAEQVQALVEGGVDGFIVETMTDLDELVLAVEAIRSVDNSRPVFASMAFDSTAKGFRTMMGVDVRSAVSRLGQLDLQAVGFNCGTATVEQYLRLADEFIKALRSTRTRAVLLAEPNAGRPNDQQGQLSWSVGPADFAQMLRYIQQKGARIVGGCCGTGPEHIKAAAKLLRG